MKMAVQRLQQRRAYMSFVEDHFDFYPNSTMDNFVQHFDSLNLNASKQIQDSKQLHVEIHAPPPEMRQESCRHPETANVGNGITPNSYSHNKQRLSLESNESMFYQHGTQDSYSSGYSGMSESYSSGPGAAIYEEHGGQDNLSGYLNDYSEVGSCIQRVIRQKIRPNDDADDFTSAQMTSHLIQAQNMTPHNVDNDTSYSSYTPSSSLLESQDFIYLEKCEKLPDLRWLPWCENEVLLILKGNRTKHMSGHITVEMMQRLSYILQRPLVRIAKEAMKLSSRLNMCTKHEIEAASRCVLSLAIAQNCNVACAKALTLYSMSGETIKQSKAVRCGIHFSVGKFQRWMLHAQLGVHIHEFAAVYLATCMETLLEEIVLTALSSQELGENVWNLEVLEYGITHSAELWGMLQPYEHLVCGRNAYGITRLPANFERHEDTPGDRTSEQDTLQECMLATCFGSAPELGDLVYDVMTYWYNNPTQLSVTSTQKLPHPVYWSSEAIQALYRYTRCHDQQPNDESKKRKVIKLFSSRTYNLMPPLHCWVSTVLSFTEYRGCCTVTPDDVTRAAAILLPSNLHNAMKHSIGDALAPSSSRKGMSAQSLHRESIRDLLYRVAVTGQHQLMTETLREMTPQDKELLNSPDEQGLTVLMKAVMQGNEEAVLCLLNHSVFINAKITNDSTPSPVVIHPITRGWSALHLAVLYNHTRIAAHLLDRGAQVDGRVRTDEENVTLTPLQLACASGNVELVNMLIDHGANPFLLTTPKNGISFTYNRGGISAFSMAAMHGQRDVLRLLMSSASPDLSECNMTLEEMLKENSACEDMYLPKSKYHIYEEIPDDVYQTIEESRPSDLQDRRTSNKAMKNSFPVSSVSTSVPSRHLGHTSSQQPANTRFGKLTKTQFQVLQDALYNAAECGFLETAHDLHTMGVPWSLFAWGRCLECAFESGKKKYTESLLEEFSTMYNSEDIGKEFVQHVVPLLFDMLRLNKDSPLKVKLSNVISLIFGKEPLPKLKRVEDKFFSIDSSYMNSPEHSDVKLVVEGLTVHAHSAVLTAASPRFSKMLQPTGGPGGQGCLGVLQLNDIRYRILQYMLHYLYHGGTKELTVDSKDIFELYAAARHYKLDGLKRHCETLCLNKMHLDNAIMVYKNAKIHQALALAEYCEGFFLQNLSHLLTCNESFHKMVYSRKRQNYNVLGGMLQCLTQKLNAKLENRRKLAPSVRI